MLSAAPHALARHKPLSSPSEKLTLILRGRYTVCCLTAPAFSQAPEVLLEQIRILRVSPFSEPVVDALLEMYAELRRVARAR